MDPAVLPKEKLKLLYNDIIKGFSVSVFNGTLIHIKHLNTLDSADFDFQYNLFLEQAKSAGSPTIEEQELFLIQEGSWSKDKNKEITNQRLFLDGMRTTKSKLFRQAEIDQVNIKIKEAEAKLRGLEEERINLLACTAESFASKKLNEYQIFKSVYLPDLTTHLFTAEQFDDLSDIDLVKLVTSFNDKLKPLNEKNLKRIALAGFFLNFFYLCKDNPFTFWGKPVINLTFFQAELFGHAMFFKGILSNSQSRPPVEYMEDPDKLIDWYNSSRSVKEQLDKGIKPEDIVGLSAKDRENLGIRGQNLQHEKLVRAAQAKRSNLSFSDIIQTIK